MQQKFLSLKPSIFFAFALVFFFTSCMSPEKATTIYNRKYAAPALQKDIHILQKILQANHPGLYQYTPKDSINWYFKQASNSIHDSLTESEFADKVAYVISKIRCGHTSVRVSSQYEKAFHLLKTPHFPLGIKTWDDSLIVLGDYLNNFVFKRGTIITSINLMSNKQMLDSVFQFISTDGFSDNFKSQLTSFNFPAAYKRAFGTPGRYEIKYIDSSGNLQTTIIPNYFPSQDVLVHTQIGLKKRGPSEKMNRFYSVSFDSEQSIAYLRVPTFEGGHEHRFFRQTFSNINQNKTKNLVVDLRENGGGTLRNTINFTRYLARKPFRVADTIAAVGRRLAYSRYIHPSLGYKFRLMFQAKKESDHLYHLTHFEKHYFDPKKKDYFQGKIYVIQGGYTFSAATLFVSLLKGQPNVTVVGEETGGGSYGNSSINLPDIILPTSKLRVVLPLYRVVFDKNNPNTGRGIFPDIYIPPSSVDIKMGIDPKLEAVKALIQKEKNN